MSLLNQIQDDLTSAVRGQSGVPGTCQTFSGGVSKRVA